MIHRRRGDLVAALCFALATVAVHAALPAAFAQAHIVEDGQPRARIVIAQDPPRMTEIAADELQAYVKRISGATLPITDEPADDATINIYVGESAHTDRLGLDVSDLSYDAYRVVSGDGWLALLGRDDEYQPAEPYAKTKDDSERVLAEMSDLVGLPLGSHGNPAPRMWRRYDEDLDVWMADGRGTINAVYDYLRGLGCRWFFPGELGEVVPAQRTLTLPDVDKTVRPDFPMRDIYQYYQQFFRASEEEMKWQWRLGLNTGHEIRDNGFRQSHGLHTLTSSEQLKKSNPEYFMLLDGVRQTKAEKPCFSSPGLVDATVKYVRFMYDQYDMPVVDISPPDGLGFRMCECDLCEGKGTSERGRYGMFSDYIWGFVNEVAKEVYKTHPDRKITCLIYQQYRLPPTKIERLSPNVAGVLAFWRSGLTGQRRDEVRQLHEDWLAKMPSNMLFRWDYYLHAGRESYYAAPVYFPQTIAQELKWLKGRTPGEHIEVFRNYEGWDRDWHALAVNHLNVYVTARLYWDVDQDVNVLLEDYYTKFYGPAAEPMQAFIEFAEQNHADISSDASLIDRSFELLNVAQAAAGEDSIYGRRIDMIVQYLQPLKALREQLSKDRNTGYEGRIRRRDASAFTLDGKLDDAFWSNISGYVLRDAETGRAAAHPTHFKLGWDKNHLYVGIHCKEKDMANLNIGATEDGSMGIWSGDVVELLIETPEQSYYQIAIAPSGAVTDLARGRGGTRMGWSADAEVAVHHGEDYWSVEVRLPVPGKDHAELFPASKISGAPPSETFPWYFNIGRQRVRDSQIQIYTFSPTGKPTFHEASKFAKMYMR